MDWYNEKCQAIRQFAKDNNIHMYDVARLSADMSTCDKCKFYCQHYDRDGTYVPFGHCNRLNNKATKPHNRSCGNWVYQESEVTNG